MDPAELVARFPGESMTPALLERAAVVGLVQPAEDGRLRVADGRFLVAGAALAELGVPPDVILDEWEALVAATDEIAQRFVTIFEAHVANRLLGPLFGYRGSFTVTEHPCTDADIPLDVHPRREECRE